MVGGDAQAYSSVVVGAAVGITRRVRIAGIAIAPVPEAGTEEAAATMTGESAATEVTARGKATSAKAAAMASKAAHVAAEPASVAATSTTMGSHGQRR